MKLKNTQQFRLVERAVNQWTKRVFFVDI